MEKTKKITAALTHLRSLNVVSSVTRYPALLFGHKNSFCELRHAFALFPTTPEREYSIIEERKWNTGHRHDAGRLQWQ